MTTVSVAEWLLLVGCNYSRSYYLQSCTELLLPLGYDIGQVILRMRTGHAQRWNMSRLAKYGWVTSKPCSGKTVRRTKKTKKWERRQTLGYKTECIILTENTSRDSCVTGERSSRFTYSLGNFKGFYSRNDKSHKKSLRGGHTAGLSSREGLAKSKNITTDL